MEKRELVEVEEAQSIVNLGRLGNLVKLGIALSSFIPKLLTLFKPIKLPENLPETHKKIGRTPRMRPIYI